MKATGIIELVILVAALIMGLPLFVMCITMSNSGLNTIYLNDKSTWDIQGDIEYELQNGVLVPMNIVEPVTISVAQAIAMPYVQDEYTPNTSRIIDYNINATTVTDDNCAELIDDTMIGNNNEQVKDIYKNIQEMSFTSADNSRVSNTDTQLVFNNLIKNTNHDDLDNGKLYFIYNQARKSWMCTSKYINLYIR